MAGAWARCGFASARTFVSALAQWPLYAPLNSGKGLVIGWLTLSNQPDTDVSGLVSWIKAPDTKAKLYPAGFTFTNGVEVVGSRYAPSGGASALNLTSGAALILDGGGLPETETNLLTAGSGNKLTGANKSSLTISTTTGLFRGNVSPDGSKPFPVSGALFQKQNAGYGYFLGTNQSGRAYLSPVFP